MMILQIFGHKKSAETRKAIRFCKERSIEHQFVDLKEREISAGELSHILNYVTPQELIDTDSTFYKKHGYDYLDYDPVEEVLEHPELMRLPLVRAKRDACVGFDEKRMEQIVMGDNS
ncbi:MAG: arsenate reductase family protein [Spirochaetota bacterium]